jgi:hypothetical protein
LWRAWRTFNDGVLTVSGGTFTGTQWADAISNNSKKQRHDYRF